MASFQVKIRSKQQILGDILRDILILTDLDDVAPGSDFSVFAEAIATSQFKIESSILKILDSTNLGSLHGIELDKKAESIKLPNTKGGVGRIPASQSIGFVKIGSNFNKISSKLYSGKPAPFSGSVKLYVEDASSFTSTGSIYIARGTVDRFEGPIPYSSIVNNGSYWTITLSSPLTKSHLSSDLVVLAQGGDRTVPAGTAVQIPANNQTPAVQFTTKEQLVIPDGEDSGTVSVVCTQFGEVGNALANSIKSFSSQPFTGATVINTSSYINGNSSEGDEDLRQRIKNYPFTLGRGTRAAILAAVLGASDPDSGRTIQSANALEPIEPGDFARVYIDDNTGLEPTFGEQAYELLVQSASGQQRQFRTAQFPITAAILQGANSAPFVIQAGQTIQVQVDEVVETYTISSTGYLNYNSASAYEIVRDLNSQANIVGFRTMNGGNQIVMIDLSGQAETMKVEAGDLQSIIGFPTVTVRPIFIYQDSKIQSFRGHTATLETRPRNEWNISVSDLTDVRVKVDGVIVTFSVADSDFTQFGTTVATATVGQFATVFASKISGVKFVTSGQVQVWSTWQTFSETGSLEILETKEDGTPATWVGDDKIWKSASSGGILSDVGYSKDFKFNRFTGELNFINKPANGTKIEIGSRSTRAFVPSLKSSSGLFDLSQNLTTVGNPKLVLGFDGEFAVRSKSISSGTTITPTIPDSTNASNIVRLTSNVTGPFDDLVVSDWFYLLDDASQGNTWGSNIEGFYQVKALGNQKFATAQTYLGPTATTNFFNGSIPLTSTLGQSYVIVTISGHGLRTGDLITTSASGAIGGISSGNLTVTNSPIIVLDDNNFRYTAGATATSSASGTILSVGTNVITITQTSHGFKSGALITVTAGIGLGGILVGALNQSNTQIITVNANTYQYRAGTSAASTATGTFTSIQYQPDTWIEFEASSPQLTDWTSILGSPQSLSANMFHPFRSTVIPQLVDFGASAANSTVDQIVSAINSSVSNGTANKLTPQQLTVRSNDYSTGTVGVLAVIGSATSLFVEPTVAESIQAHTAYSISADVAGGFPVIQSVFLPTVQASGYPTRTYIKTDRNLTDIQNTNFNPTIQAPTDISTYPIGFQEMWITGRQSTLVGRTYNNQTAAPYTGILRGTDMIRPVNTSDTEQTSPDTLNRYANYSIRLQDLSFTKDDKFVIEMDNNPTDRTVAIPLAKIAKIQDIDAIAGAGKGQVISLRLKDPEDSNLPFFDPTSVYKDFDFADFKLLTKSVGLYREDVSDRALVLRSTQVGGQNRLRFSVRLPTEPDQQNFVITHSSAFDQSAAYSVSDLNLIAVLPSDVAVTNSSYGSGSYLIVSTVDGSGPDATLYDWRITGGTLNSNSNYSVGNVLNLSGNNPNAESYLITSSDFKSITTATAQTDGSTSTLTINAPSHGLLDGDLITVTTAGAIGGISAADLSRVDVPVTVVGPNNFLYDASAASTSIVSGPIDLITSGQVTVKSPGIGIPGTYNAAQAPIRTWPLLDKSFTDLADAINAYYPDSPVATAEAIGTNLVTNPISEPTYIAYPNAVIYTGTDMAGAFDWHSFANKYAGSAGIWQYDSTISGNSIKATVQSNDSIFPTTTDASGTTYSPINEEVYLVPSNNKTVRDWFEFKAASSLNILASIERSRADSKLQVSSREDGSAGAVYVTGVNANRLSTGVIGNGSDTLNSSMVNILNADAKTLGIDELVKVQNLISSDILRSYRTVPSGSSETSANTSTITNYFRSTDSVKYIRVNSTTGRLIFLRNGLGNAQTEPLTIGNTIQFTNLGAGLVQVDWAIGTGSDNGRLSARVGDMMYIQPSSPFAANAKCKPVPSTGITDGTNPEYLGYPVVHVVNTSRILIIAPNITTFNTTALTASTDLVFIPAIWNEKNIRTNHAEGAKFDAVINNGAYYLIKKLGNGIVSVWLQNSSGESTDDMKLNTMSVSTDDFVVFGTGFDAANQGTYKLIAHNGRNHLIVYNPSGGKDELIDTNNLSNGGTGDRNWRVGPLDSGFTRPIRIIAGDSVRIGDKLRISSPASTATQWFNSSFFGSFTITKIGMQALNYTGDPLPHTTSDGVYNQNYISPYIDFEMTDAPVSIKDDSNADVDNFLIASNTASIGFVEGSPFFGFRRMSGCSVSPINSELGDVYLTPQLSTQKMSDVFGTVLTGFGKLNFTQQIFQGIDGYKIYSGLVQVAHRIIDGLPQDPVLYGGVKAAGTFVEVLTSLINNIQIVLQVHPKDGVTLNSIVDLIRSSVSAYVNTLGPGKPVVISEISRIVQSLPGVFSVKVISTTPVADDDRIVVGDGEKAYIRDSSTDVVIG